MSLPPTDRNWLYTEAQCTICKRDSQHCQCIENIPPCQHCAEKDALLGECQGLFMALMLLHQRQDVVLSADVRKEMKVLIAKIGGA